MHFYWKLAFYGHQHGQTLGRHDCEGMGDNARRCLTGISKDPYLSAYNYILKIFCFLIIYFSKFIFQINYRNEILNFLS